jgi:FkbM family methyltransferase
VIAPPSIYVINRRQDEARLAHFIDAAARHSVQFTRIEAIDGHDPATPWFLYRDLLGPHFWQTDRLKPGAFACFLSHRAAWQRMLADKAETALICEDDTILTDPPVALQDLEFDILFANDRLVSWAQAVGAQDTVALPDLIGAMQDAGVAPGRGNLTRAPGADGYILSSTGARALLEATAHKCFVAGIDWLLLAFALTPSQRPDWPEFRALADLRIPPAPLRAFVAPHALVKKTDVPSVLNHKAETRLLDFACTSPVQKAPSEPTPETAIVPMDLPDDPVSAAFAAGTYPELPALELLRRWFPAGGIFVDIGAHIGAHSLFLLRHGNAGRVVPFEFDPEATEALRALVSMNGLEDRVDLSHLGFGLAEESGRRAARGAIAHDLRLKRDFVEEVKVRPGDALLRDEPDISLIKIDVNGEEREVLKGLKKTLKRKTPMLAIDMTKERTAKAMPLLERLGYAEVERVEWEDETGHRRFVMFGPVAVPQADPSAVEADLDDL